MQPLTLSITVWNYYPNGLSKKSGAWSLSGEWNVIKSFNSFLKLQIIHQISNLGVQCTCFHLLHWHSLLYPTSLVTRRPSRLQHMFLGKDDQFEFSKWFNIEYFPFILASTPTLFSIHSTPACTLSHSLLLRTVDPKRKNGFVTRRAYISITLRWRVRPAYEVNFWITYIWMYLKPFFPYISWKLHT